MKKYIALLLALVCLSCAHTNVIWSIDSCEVALVTKCKAFCKANHAVVEDFVKTYDYYKCTCGKEMEVRFFNAC